MKPRSVLEERGGEPQASSSLFWDNTSQRAYPSQEVYYYLQKRPLPRPKMNAWRFALIMLAYLSAGPGLGYVLYLSGWLGWDLASSQWTASAVVTVVAIRWLVIGLVQLYQHYASEETRRECVLVPTCSEYCIMCVRRYGAVIGSIKTLKRLLFRCKGQVCGEDWPY